MKENKELKNIAKYLFMTFDFENCIKKQANKKEKRYSLFTIIYRIRRSKNPLRKLNG